MNDDNKILPEQLCDETAAEMLELLYALARILENRYFGQIRRYYQNTDPKQTDLWD